MLGSVVFIFFSLFTKKRLPICNNIPLNVLLFYVHPKKCLSIYIYLIANMYCFMNCFTSVKERFCLGKKSSSCNYVRKSLDVTDFFLKHKKITEQQKQKSPNHIVSSIVHISNKFGIGVCFRLESHAGKIAMYESYRFGLLLFIHHNGNNKKRKHEK